MEDTLAVRVQEEEKEEEEDFTVKNTEEWILRNEKCRGGE